MAAIPFMPLYVADYLADAAHLSTAEHGAYLLLLMTYWQTGKPLPDDDKKLARITGLSGRNWLRARPVICEFFDLRDNKLVHRRVELELARVRDKSLKNRKGGLARAEQVRANAQQTLSHTDTDADRVPLSNDNGPNADPDKAFWDGAKGYLGSGKGGLINKLCGQYGRQAVADAVTLAMLSSPQPPDRTAFLVGILKRQPKAEAVIGI